MKIIQDKLIARGKLVGKRFSISEDILIDTGAAFTVVPVEVADFLELRSYEEQPKVELVTASGLIKPSVKILERLEIGNIKMERLPVVIHDIPDPAPIKILLGMNFIKRTKFVVNGKEKLFEIEDP